MFALPLSHPAALARIESRPARYRHEIVPVAPLCRLVAAAVNQRGSTLLLVLWAIMLMSFAVMGLVEHLSRGVDEAIYSEKEFRARLLLQSARTLSAHPDIEWGDPLLSQTISPTSSYQINLSTEGVRLAINQISANPA